MLITILFIKERSRLQNLDTRSSIEQRSKATSCIFTTETELKTSVGTAISNRNEKLKNAARTGIPAVVRSRVANERIVLGGVALLYESFGENQVDALPPVPILGPKSPA